MAAPVRQIAEWLGVEPKDKVDLEQIMRKGLPLTIQSVFLSRGMTKAEFPIIVIPLRTFRHRTERLNRGAGGGILLRLSWKSSFISRPTKMIDRIMINS